MKNALDYFKSIKGIFNPGEMVEYTGKLIDILRPLGHHFGANDVIANLDTDRFSPMENQHVIEYISNLKEYKDDKEILRKSIHIVGLKGLLQTGVSNGLLANVIQHLDKPYLMELQSSSVFDSSDRRKIQTAALLNDILLDEMKSDFDVYLDLRYKNGLIQLDDLQPDSIESSGRVGIGKFMLIDSILRASAVNQDIKAYLQGINSLYEAGGQELVQVHKSKDDGYVREFAEVALSLDKAQENIEDLHSKLEEYSSRYGVKSDTLIDIINNKTKVDPMYHIKHSIMPN